MKNLDRLKKQNVRSSEPKNAMTSLSLERLRQVAGGTNYSHSGNQHSCVGAVQ